MRHMNEIISILQKEGSHGKSTSYNRVKWSNQPHHRTYSMTDFNRTTSQKNGGNGDFKNWLIWNENSKLTTLPKTLYKITFS